jgi:hypothetical protein
MNEGRGRMSKMKKDRRTTEDCGTKQKQPRKMTRKNVLKAHVMGSHNRTL